jgi:hypothetical protein
MLKLVENNDFKSLNTYFDMHDLINQLIGLNKLDHLKMIEKHFSNKFSINKSHIATAISISGNDDGNNFEILDWLYDNRQTYPFDDYNILHLTADVNNFPDVLNWYYERSHKYGLKVEYDEKLINEFALINYGIKFNNIYISRYQYNVIDILDWFIDHPDFELKYTSEILINAVESYNIKFLEWWYQKYKLGYVKFEYDCYLLTNLIKYNRNNEYTIETIKWFISHSDDLELKYTPRAFDTNISMLKYLYYEQNVIKIILDENTIYNISSDSYDAKDTLDFWYDHRDEFGFICDTYIIDNIKHPNTLRWFLNKLVNCELPDLKYTSYSMDNHWLDITQVWFEFKDKLELKYTSKLLDNNTYIPTFEWWNNHKDYLELKYTDISLNKRYIKYDVLKWWLDSGLPLKFNPESILNNISELNGYKFDFDNRIQLYQLILSK